MEMSKNFAISSSRPTRPFATRERAEGTAPLETPTAHHDHRNRQRSHTSLRHGGALEKDAPEKRFVGPSPGRGAA